MLSFDRLVVVNSLLLMLFIEAVLSILNKGDVFNLDGGNRCFVKEIVVLVVVVLNDDENGNDLL